MQKISDKKKDLKRLKKQLALTKRGVNAYHQQDYKTALKIFNDLMDYDPTDLTNLTVMADCLVKLGVRDVAVKVIDHCLQHNEPDVDVFMTLGKLAQDMELYEIAIKLYRGGIDCDPQHLFFYNNIASVLGAMEKFDEAIEFLQNVLPAFPESAPLWNTLASQVQYRDGYQAAVVFFKEALRLDPNFDTAWSNLGIAVDDVQEAIECDRKALKINPDNIEPYLGLAHLLLDQGELKEGWACYEKRRDKRRMAGGGQGMIFTHNLPEWKGQDLKGKSILVCAEQGLGDEIMFGSLVQEIIKDGAKVYIGVNNRLVGLFSRAFPEATIVGYATKQEYGFLYRSFPNVELAIRRGELSIDYFTAIASPAQYYWSDPKRLPVYRAGYLKAKEENIEKWRQRISALPNGLNVGIAWRSGNMAASRVSQYASSGEFAPILTVEGVNFINMQYGNVAEEIKAFEDDLDVKIHTWDDFDVKMDLETNYAVAANLDLVIAPGTTPGVISMTAGTPTRMFGKRIFYWRLGQDHVPMFPNCKIDVVSLYDDYSALFQSYRQLLQDMVKEKLG